MAGASFLGHNGPVANLMLPLLFHLQVPLQLYNYSEAAFFVATILNLLNLIFEDTPEKQQLALLSVVIKALSWHCDHLIVNGHAVIKRDAWGAL
jgi:hypothetical protein